MLSLFQWGLIGVVIFIIFIFVKFKYLKHKLTWVIIIILILIGYIGFFVSTSGHEINLNSTQGIETAGKLYLGWLGNSFSNLKTISSNAVKLDWTSNNTEVINGIKNKEK